MADQATIMFKPQDTSPSLWTTVRDRWSALAPRAALTLGSLVLLAGCDSGKQRDIFGNQGDAGQISSWMYNYIFWITAVIFVIVAAIFTYAVIRFRVREDDDGSLPKQVHGHLTAEIGWTIAPTLIVIAIMVPTVQSIGDLSDIHYVHGASEKMLVDPNEVVYVEVTGKQWWWEFDYRTFNGFEDMPEDVLKDPELLAKAQQDPSNWKYEHSFSTANELHVPVGKRVFLNITSADVIHAFWVPRLFGKRDATPGREYPLYFTANEPGEYFGQCAELCGESHALMGIKVFVHPTEGPDSYASWLEAQKQVSAPPSGALAEQGKELFISKGCIACHTIRGDERTEMNYLSRSRTTGPDLTHVGSRTTIAAITLPNTRENLTRWIWKPGEVKGNAIMAQERYNPTKLTEEEATAIASYLIRLK